MRQKIKKAICTLLLWTMVLTCFQVQPIHAGTTYTKSKINSMIKQNQKKLKTYQKKQKAEKKKYDKQTKGTVSIALGDLRSTNPYIVYDSWSRTTYWITNPENMTTLLSSSTGYIKPTGEYRTYNYTTCAVAKAVKVTASPSKYDKKISKLKDTISNLKGALKSYIVIPEAGEENLYITVGETKTLSWYWSEYYSTKYTKNSNIKFTSNDPTVLKVIDAKKGKVKALKKGYASISVKAPLSGKTTWIHFKVLSPSGEYAAIRDSEFEVNPVDNTLIAHLELDSDKPIPDVNIHSEDGDVIKESSYLRYDSEKKIVISFELKEEGLAPVTFTTDSGFEMVLYLEVYRGEDGNLHIRIDSVEKY